MTRASGSAIFTAKRVFWGCAGFVLPVLNPPLILAAGVAGGVFLAVALSFGVLWLASQRAWPDPSARILGLFWGMLVMVACTVVAAFAEFFLALLIAAQNCPPDAYECPF
jgi:hypothetical protein